MLSNTKNNLFEITRQLRYNIIRSTTAAGTGHPTSSLSGVEFMTAIMFDGHFAAVLDNPLDITNDRLIFSKGHACPLLYSLYYTLGHVSESELMSLRKFGSVLEGHPTMRWQYTEAATGSLGQGLGVAVGMALALRSEFENSQNLTTNTYLDINANSILTSNNSKKIPKVYCIMGDSEIAEGSVWEAMNCASYYQLSHLVAVVDLNRLGQRGETQIGHHSDILKARCEAFGWETWVIDDGNDLESCSAVFDLVAESISTKPKMVIAKTYKGAGISFLQDKEGWHGKALSATDCSLALVEISTVDLALRAQIPHPTASLPTYSFVSSIAPNIIQKSELSKTVNLTKYQVGKMVSTRKAFGIALNELGSIYPQIVSLDAEMSNSTFSEIFTRSFPERSFEMFIAEQNMISVATGLSRMGKIPFISTFAAFLSRASDQIRMAQYSHSNLKIMGSHCGVSIGLDGSSQMAVEDISLFRCILNSVVLYPSDAVSTAQLMRLVVSHTGISYLRCTRADTPVLYSEADEFVIGGSKTLFSSDQDIVTVIAAGITLYEAIKAYHILNTEGIKIRVIDLYSIKPLDKETLKKASLETKAFVVVEDHYREGGVYEAVCASGVIAKPIYSLCVSKISCSGTPEELLHYMEIDASAIVKLVKSFI